MRGSLCASQNSSAVQGAVCTVRKALPKVGLGSCSAWTSRKHASARARYSVPLRPVVIVKIERLRRTISSAPCIGAAS
jgi:hypothetical protein